MTGPPESAPHRAVRGDHRRPAATADHVLVPAGRETAFRPGAPASRISRPLIVGRVVVGVAQRASETSDGALRATRAVLYRFLNDQRGRSRGTYSQVKQAW
ncbi:hypothetical protein ACQP1K_14260 [Sphaerimonospora sp. CA-214678]|uniref:hypothetical protein n=1 Tax=Sphaerimonospora sp. CA-214678 TaxID=3240029 RepID=UPI003D8DFB7D